ncbi:MAG: cell division FtsZ family protein [Bacteroidaceae bacterium]|nr:cell division FtsZ family protein [Bacteroidaceae bacterium]
MNDRLGAKIAFKGFEKRAHSIIKVLGVGGGGCNAVRHMHMQGLADVSFAVCNTDWASLDHSSVDKRIRLGADGRGVGGDPIKGQLATEKSADDIREMFSDGTQMVFVTTGLGGGTGTGGAPVISRIAKEMGILTVGIVTLPFLYEGLNRIDKALIGLEEMYKNVDSLMVINNQRLFEVYPSLPMDAALACADETLCVAAKSIVDIIMKYGTLNADFNDVRTVLENGGVAIISTAYAEGVDRLNHAIDAALNTPLLNNNNVYKSKRLLMTIFDSKAADGEPLTVAEFNELTAFMSRFDERIESKHSFGTDNSLGKKVKVTILASGFGLEEAPDDEDIYGEEMYRLTQGERLQILYEYFYGRINRSQRKWNTFVFLNKELDEDDVISDIETSPTYKRTSRFVGNIRMNRNKT